MEQVAITSRVIICVGKLSGRGLLTIAMSNTPTRLLDTSVAGLKDGLNRCPQCGATDVLQRPGGVLMCRSCRHEWPGERIEEQFKLGEGIKDLRGTVIGSGAQDIAPDAATVMSFKCGGCGAEVTINTDNAMTARCHWCRHVLGVNEQVANGAVPDAVLPFRVAKEIAIARIRRFVGDRRFVALGAFKRQFRPENVCGVFLPYMVVDANASVDLAGYGEVTTCKHTRKGGDEYDADIYRLGRHVDFTVNDLELESSSARRRLNSQVNTNNIINAILPFDTSNAVKWNASYLLGMSSERRDLDLSALRPRLEEQLLSIARARVGLSMRKRYDRGVRWERERVSLHGTRWVTMLLPVWLYSYLEPGPDGGMLHYIAVNGRTGETMGSVPIDKGKLLLIAIAVGVLVECLAIWSVIFAWAGPPCAIMVYWHLFQRYRNTEKSNDFEHRSDTRFEPVTGSDEKVDELIRTVEVRISGDNLDEPRQRVARDPGVDS